MLAKYANIVNNMLNREFNDGYIVLDNKILYISIDDQKTKALERLQDMFTNSEFDKVYGVIVCGPSIQFMEMEFYRRLHGKLKECRKRCILKNFLQVEPIDMDIITRRKYKDSKELFTIFLSLLLSFVDDKNTLQYEITTMKDLQNDEDKFNKTFYDIYKQDPTKITELFLRILQNVDTIEKDTLNNILCEEFINVKPKKADKIKVLFSCIRDNVYLLSSLLNMTKHIYIYSQCDDYNEMSIGSLITLLYGVNSDIQNSEHIDEIIDADISICCPPNVSNQMEYIIKCILDSDKGIFVINKSTLTDYNKRRTLLKYADIDKIINIGKYNAINDRLILVCSKKQAINDNKTAYYDLSAISEPNCENKDELLLNYYTDSVNYEMKNIKGKYLEWLYNDVSIEEINKYLHEKLTNICLLKCLLNTDDMERIHGKVINSLQEIGYKKCKLTDILQPVRNINMFSSKSSNYGNIPLYDQMFKIIAYIGTSKPSVDNDNIVCFNERGEYFYSSPPYCLTGKVNVYKQLVGLSDIDLLIIGYQLMKYSIEETPIEYINVFITQI